MKISDLAALVTVRNHIGVVQNDRASTDKITVQVLSSIRLQLDKRFVEILTSNDLEGLFTPEIISLTNKPTVPADYFSAAKEAPVFAVAGLTTDAAEPVVIADPVNVDVKPLNKPKPEAPPVDEELVKRIAEEKAALKKKAKKADK
jgi:hypothetical protein